MLTSETLRFLLSMDVYEQYMKATCMIDSVRVYAYVIQVVLHST